ncbi:MAG: PaaI family thioesterase [Acidobacteriota bacterium]|nr:PaaI family thioesterase [Acidobacteriota bacterium]
MDRQESDELVTRRAIADELRSLAAMVMLSTAPPPEMEATLALLRQASGRLSAPRRSGRYDGLPGLSPGSASNVAIWETHGAFGPANPLAPPVRAEEGDGRIVGTVTFGSAWEGGPGSVYGGFIAAAFDGVLGRAVISAGHLAVTRSLAVRFLRPTPLHTELRIEGSAQPRSGRQVAVEGSLWCGDEQTCAAEAVFVCVEPSHYRAP